MPEDTQKSINDKDIELGILLSERYQKEQKESFDKNKDNREKLLYKDHIQKVTGIQTDINESCGSLEEIKNNIDNVEKIRFELDNKDYTQWYEWHPDIKDHQLTCILDHYCSGDIVDIIGNRVYTAQFGDDFEYKHITYPAPYNKRTSHLFFRTYQKLRALTKENSDNKFSQVALFSRKENCFESDVDPEIELYNILSERTTYILGSILNICTMIATISTGYYFGFNYASAMLFGILFLAVLFSEKILHNSHEFEIALFMGFFLSLFKKIKNLNRVEKIDCR